MARVRPRFISMLRACSSITRNGCQSARQSVRMRARRAPFRTSVIAFVRRRPAGPQDCRTPRASNRTEASSAAAKYGGPLLNERPHTLLRILGVARYVLRERFELQCSAQVDVEVVEDRPFRTRNGDGWTVRNLARELVRLRHQRFRRNHGVDDAQPECFGGVDRITGEDQLTRLCDADDPRQEVGAAP